MNDAKLNEIQQNVDRIASAMDDCIRIPGTKIRLGWDSIVGVIPGLGDIVTLAPQIYLIAQALRAGVRKRVFLKMVLNSLIDFLLGVIPGLGDIFDVLWKSNRKNAELLREEIARRKPGPESRR